jgi:hypothetical protein
MVAPALGKADKGLKLSHCVRHRRAPEWQVFAREPCQRGGLPSTMDQVPASCGIDENNAERRAGNAVQDIS